MEEVEYVAQANPRPLMVHKDQDVEQVFWNIQQNNFVGHNNKTSIVEQILAQSGLNMYLHRPNFISTLSDIFVNRVAQGLESTQVH